MRANRGVTCITLSSILLVFYVVWFMYPHLPVKKKKRYAVLTDLSTPEDSLSLMRRFSAVFNPSVSPNPNLLRMVGSSKCSSLPTMSSGSNPDYFTILVAVRKDNDLFLRTVEHYCVMKHVDQVLIVWNGLNDLQEGALDVKCPVCVMFLKQPDDLATNRFKPFLHVRTQAVLCVEDHLLMTKDDVMHAFDVWKEKHHLIVGFDPRIVQSKHSLSKHPLILPGAAFLHVFYLHLFTHYSPKALVTAANQYTDCEDLVMSVVVARYLAEQGVPQCPHILLAIKTGISVPYEISGLSSTGQDEENCVQSILDVYDSLNLDQCNGILVS